VHQIVPIYIFFINQSQEEVMKKLGALLFTVLLFFAFAGCGPDLVVKTMSVNWNTTNKKAKATIANIGDEDAGPFLVYFNAEENPVSQNYRPQVTHQVPGLAKGASIVLNADFAPLARPQNHYLGNVYKISVLVDPKGMVKESNENNNSKEMPIN
jgi:hypothetical protein